MSLLYLGMPEPVSLVHLTPGVRLPKKLRGKYCMTKLSVFHRFSLTVPSACALAGLMIVAAATCALAQNPAPKATDAQTPVAQKPADYQKPEDDQGPPETVKVNVDVVGLFFNVKD